LTKDPSIACIILAAGQGKRLGGTAKALLKTTLGSTFLESILRLTRTRNVSNCVCVVAHPYMTDVVKEANRIGLNCVENPNPSRGMSSSVETGFSFALKNWNEQGALLWPVDHAFIRERTLDSICDNAKRDNIIVPTFQDRGGHPAYFGADFWPALACCTKENQGARSVSKANFHAQLRISVTDPGVIKDVDHPEDLIER